MEPALPCCQAIRQPTASPFDVVQLDYYDGTTAGLARCRSCSTAYTFDTLGTAEEGLRAFAFARVDSAHFAAVATAVDSPPGPTEDLAQWRERVALAEARFPTRQQERNLLVLARHLEEEVVSSRRVDASEWVALARWT